MPTFLLFLRMLLALAFVLGLVFVATRLMVRFKGMTSGAGRPSRASRTGLSRLGAPGGAARAGRSRGGWLAGLAMTGPSTPAELEIELVSRRALSKASSLLVVRAGERYLLLGSTPQSVQLITELGPSLLEGPSGEVAATERALAASAGGLSSPGLSLPGVTNVERAGAHVAPGFAAQPDLPRGAPWTALQDDQGSTTAWDAFLASLRERTVRR